jgi:hydroxymethylpyrimidine/phosphomethylpyrimidine kinase
VVTPNVPEAEALLDRRIETLADQRAAARRLVELGAGAALVKGGHLGGAEAIDVLDDGRSVEELRAPRLDTPHTHGTGCMTAAALAACLARGLPLREAAHEAKRFIGVAIAHALAIGGGSGPANALAWLDEPGC